MASERHSGENRRNNGPFQGHYNDKKTTSERQRDENRRDNGPLQGHYNDKKTASERQRGDDRRENGPFQGQHNYNKGRSDYHPPRPQTDHDERRPGCSRDTVANGSLQGLNHGHSNRGHNNQREEDQTPRQHNNNYSKSDKRPQQEGHYPKRQPRDYDVQRSMDDRERLYKNNNNSHDDNPPPQYRNHDYHGRTDDNGRNYHNPPRHDNNHNYNNQRASNRTRRQRDNNNRYNNEQPTHDPALQNAAKRIFQFAQIQHHIRNWDTDVPTTIKRNVDNVLRNINPPLINDDYRFQLSTAGIDFADDIRATTSAFLRQQLDNAKEALSTISLDTNLTHAAAIATGYTKRLTRMRPVDRDAYVREAINLIRSKQPAPNPPQPGPNTITQPTTPRQNAAANQATDSETTATNNDMDVTTTEVPNNPPAAEKAWTVVAGRKGKRRHRSDDGQHSPSIPDFTEAREPSPLSNAETAPMPPTKTPAKKRRANNYLTTPAGVKVLTVNKESFTFDGLDVSKLIVIGDSNLRNAPTVPDGLEIVSIPGGQLRHVIRAIRNYSSDSEERHLRLAVQIGINHRDNDTSEIDHWIADLQNSLHDCDSLKEFFMIGVSYPTSLNDFQMTQLDILNDSMREYIGDHHFIEPLHPNEVEILPNDRWGIHHQPATTRKIIDALAKASRHHPVF